MGCNNEKFIEMKKNTRLTNISVTVECDIVGANIASTPALSTIASCYR